MKNSRPSSPPKNVDPSDDAPLLPEEEEVEEKAAWETTLADLSMLLLTFFVLLYSMSTLDSRKFEQSFFSVRVALEEMGGKGSGVKVLESEGGVFVDEVRMLRELEQHQQQVFSDFNMYATQHGLAGIVGARLEAGKITLVLPEAVLFPKGQAELTPEGRRAVAGLRDFFIQVPDQRVLVVGHTDSAPVAPGSRFRDNWELSTLRAVAVVRALMEMGISANRLSAMGLADSQPILPETDEVSRARNRRVEFVLEKMIGGR
ncbi:MAG: flagellar motor protein MotB [Desulfomicrobiaceae bacterium]|jgi:chemotaxis protein MotB|nr:flagellar motor protein MotB [Desulfomicrobiaceae bacterium]